MSSINVSADQVGFNGILVLALDGTMESEAVMALFTVSACQVLVVKRLTCQGRALQQDNKPKARDGFLKPS